MREGGERAGRIRGEEEINASKGKGVSSEQLSSGNLLRGFYNAFYKQH